MAYIAMMNNITYWTCEDGFHMGMIVYAFLCT